MKPKPHYTFYTIHYTFIAILAGLVYVLLPTANSTLDSWGYAGAVRWGTDLFSPHHLLYNAFGWLVFQAASVLGEIDALALLKVLNGLVAGACLYVLGKILTKRGVAKKEVVNWMLFAGGSFGLMRFAVDSETYVMPLLLSLAGSYCVFFYPKNKSSRDSVRAFCKTPLQLILGGLLLASACLFHQLHVWWWLGILVGVFFSKGWKSALYYAVPAMVVPLAYGLVVWRELGEVPDVEALLSFVLHDFAREDVQVDLGLKSLLLTPVSLFRTFFQVHGSVWLFLQKLPLLWLTVLGTVFCVGKALLRKWPIIFFKQSGDTFSNTHALILILHFLFAMLSHGNAEFMVMIPFLIPLAAGTGFRIAPKTVVWLAAAMWIWNLSLAIVPQHFASIHDDAAVAEQIYQEPNAHFILANKHTVANQYYYHYGDTLYQRLHDFPPRDPERLCALQALGVAIYSDVPDRPVLLSRGSMLAKEHQSTLTKENQKIDLQGFAGAYALWKVGVGCEE